MPNTFAWGSLLRPITDRVLDRLSEPRLQIGPEVEKSRRQTPDEERDQELTTTVFRVPVHNKGKSAAKNCRVKLHLKGQAKFPTWVDDDAVSDSAQGPQFEVKTGLCWSDPGKPATVTINRDGTMHFDLVMIQHLQSREESTEKVYEAVKFPTEAGWGRSPIEITATTFEDGLPKPPEGDFRLNRDQVTNAEYSKAELTVTAENAESVSATVVFTNGRGWPEVTIDRGRELLEE